jgi:hypothetical protein
MDAPIGIFDAGRLAVARSVANQLACERIVDPAEAADQVVAAAGVQT